MTRYLVGAVVIAGAWCLLGLVFGIIFGKACARSMDTWDE